ncbi:hypothetical protein BDF14DRAFT_1715442, partial [Spinellus fusiger]
LARQEKDLALFHLSYNPLLECTYQLPEITGFFSKQVQEKIHYVGDKGLVLAVSYKTPPAYCSPCSAPSRFALGNPMFMVPPQPVIHWLCVSISWIVSGVAPFMPVQQIYHDRYEALDHRLANYGCYKYNPYSDQVLAHIVSGQSDIPPGLLNFLQSHTHEYQTRLSRLQQLLEGVGVDARVIWKYSFAKSCAVSNGFLLREEDVVNRIQVLEAEWHNKYLRLTQRLQ